MAIFRSKSKAQTDARVSRYEDEELKVHTANVHDTILSAVNEQQPFEQAADRSFHRRPSYLSNESQDLKDIFGNPIRQADISNPTRSRNERPLDTIRGFEYSITGDVSYRDQLESQRLGWGFHEDFPHYNMARVNEGEHGETLASYSRPVANFDGGNQTVFQAGNYSATSLQAEQKPKKRGLFGRKKK